METANKYIIQVLWNNLVKKFNRVREIAIQETQTHIFWCSSQLSQRKRYVRPCLVNRGYRLHYRLQQLLSTSMWWHN